MRFSLTVLILSWILKKVNTQNGISLKYFSGLDFGFSEVICPAELKLRFSEAVCSTGNEIEISQNEIFKIGIFKIDISETKFEIFEIEIF